MISIESKDRIVIITFNTDNINALNVDEIKNQIIKTLEAGNSRVVIDLANIKYLDSTGYGCLFQINRAARDNLGIIKFTGITPEVIEVFRTLHLNTILEIHDDRETCIRLMQ